MKNIEYLITSFLLLAFLAMPAPAAELAGVTLPDTLRIEDNPLVLSGIALREKYIFDVYVAGLYLPEKNDNAMAILEADEPRIMVMSFLRTVKAEKITVAWNEGFKDNVPDADDELKAKFADLGRMMRDMYDSEEMVFTYVPGIGTAVEIKEDPMGVIPGKDFADALLLTWIGPKPGPGKAFKEELLK